MRVTRHPIVSAILAAAVAQIPAAALPARAFALVELRFVAAPALPTLPGVVLNAHAQTVTTAMTGFSVEDTRLTKSGWNLTVEGQSGSGKSAVFAQYCGKAKCGSDSEGYVPAGKTLAANSLTLNSSGASFTGGLGTAPTLQCAAICNVDSPTPVKVASDASGVLAGEGTWAAGGFSTTSLALTLPTTVRALANEEVYRANIVWTLSTGP
jgi:hypothetical protein